MVSFGLFSIFEKYIKQPITIFRRWGWKTSTEAENAGPEASGRRRGTPTGKILAFFPKIVLLEILPLFPTKISILEILLKTLKRLKKTKKRKIQKRAQSMRQSTSQRRTRVHDWSQFMCDPKVPGQKLEISKKIIFPWMKSNFFSCGSFVDFFSRTMKDSPDLILATYSS